MNLPRRAVTALLMVAAVVGLSAGPVSARGIDREDAVQVSSRDVFVVIGNALHNPDASTDPAAPLYNSAGVPLNITWGQWSAGAAVSGMHVSGRRSPTTTVGLYFERLVPGGVYSVFYGTFGPDSENPACPGVERLLPLASVFRDQSPDPSSFVARDDGSGWFLGRVPGDLQAATQVFFSVIYHFDGETYHPLPNRGEHLTQGGTCRSSFGEDAMRHLQVLQKW